MYTSAYPRVYPKCTFFPNFPQNVHFGRLCNADTIPSLVELSNPLATRPRDVDICALAGPGLVESPNPLATRPTFAKWPFLPFLQMSVP